MDYFQRVKPDVIKYEIRQLNGVTAAESQVNKRKGKFGSIFGKLLSGVGRFVGAVAAPLSVLFPPAALGAAAAYGFAKLGDVAQARSADSRMDGMMQAYGNMSPGQSAQGPMIGLTDISSNIMQESVPLFDPMGEANRKPAADLLLARNGMDMTMPQQK